MNTNSSFTAIFSNENSVTGTGVVLTFIKDWWNQDCAQVLRKNTNAKTGNYNINPDWLLSKTVFCEMDFEWWGWTECASENNLCSFEGTKDILYWIFEVGKFKIKNIINSTNCTNWVFWDPAPWIRKNCYYR